VGWAGPTNWAGLSPKGLGRSRPNAPLYFYGLGWTWPRHQGWARTDLAQKREGGTYFPPPILLHAKWYSFCMQEEMKTKRRRWRRCWRGKKSWRGGGVAFAGLAEDSGFVGCAVVEASGRERETEGDQDCRLLGRLPFWLSLDPDFSPLGAWKSHLFIGGGRETLRLFQCQMSALGSTKKHSNHCFKEAMMNCQFCVGKCLVGLATLGLFILACSQVS